MWKFLLGVTAVAWVVIAFLALPEAPPRIEPEPYQPTLAERNLQWSRLCSEVDCSTLPMGYFTIDLNRGPFPIRLDEGPRLFVPMDENGDPAVSGWGLPVTAANFDDEGRRLRQYYSGYRFEMHCCDRLSDALGLDTVWPDLGLSNFVTIHGAARSQNSLGWHLFSDTNRVVFPEAPPQEFLEDFDDLFWRVTHWYKRNGDRIDASKGFLSKKPLIAGRYLFAQCGGAGCSFHTLEGQNIENSAPFVQFDYSETYRMEKSICAGAKPFEKCDPIDETIRVLVQPIATLDAIIGALQTPN